MSSSKSLLDKFCPDGFSFKDQNGFFLSICVREALLMIVPIIIYILIGSYRFTSLWDVPVWNRWYIHDFFLNHRISFVYKLAWLVKLISLLLIILLLIISTIYSIVNSIIRNDFANINILVDLAKSATWFMVLINFFFETRRNLKCWIITKLFYFSYFIATLIQEIYYIQHFFYDFKMDINYNVYDLRSFSFQIILMANLLLICMELLGICFPIICQYKDQVVENKLKKKIKTGVHLRIIDIVELIYMGWYYLLPGLLFAISQGISNQMIADKAGKVIDATTMDEVKSLCSPFLYLIPINSISTIFQMTFLVLGGETILMKMRNKLLGSLTMQDSSYFQRIGLGYLISRITTDCDIIGYGLSIEVTTLVPPGISVVTGIVLLMKNSLTLAILLISLLLICFTITVLRSRLITQRYAAIYSDKRAHASKKATEVIQGIDVVKTYGKEIQELDGFKKYTSNQRLTGFKKGLLESLFVAVESILNKSIIACGVFFGSALVFSNQIEKGELNSFLLVGITTINDFYTFVDNLPELFNISAPTERVFTLMKLKPKTDLNKGQIIPPEQFKGKIEFENISFAYPSLNSNEENATIIQNFSLTIEPGENVAFCGSSGSGKSTILALTMRFFDVTEGRILIDGYDIKTIKLKWWLEQLGIVAQQSFLFQGTIEENIKYSCKEKHDYDNDNLFQYAMDISDARSVVDSHDGGIHFNVGARGDALSGGQKQRISIARMVRKQPNILILDEVTSALDPESEEVAMRGLQEFSKGKTTLCVSHRLHTIIFCDKIVCMNRGKIIEMGKHVNLMKIEGGYYRALFEKQLSISTGNPSYIHESNQSTHGYEISHDKNCHSLHTVKMDSSFHGEFELSEMSQNFSQFIDTIEAYDYFDRLEIKNQVEIYKKRFGFDKKSLMQTSNELRHIVEMEEKIISQSKSEKAPLLQMPTSHPYSNRVDTNVYYKI